MRACGCLQRCLAGGGASASSEADAPGPPVSEEDYQVQVAGFELARRGRFVIYTLTVSRGDARWPIRRRYRQVLMLHAQLIQLLGRSSMRAGLPRLPSRLPCRQMLFGRRDQGMLRARARQLQDYFGALLRHIPYVDQCEVLHEFLCSPDVASMGYEALMDLQEAVGHEPTSGRPVTDSEIEALPQRSSCSVSSTAGVMTDGCCPICQEHLRDDEDVRVLPCGHEYHFKCIEQWIRLKNKCCVCQSMAVMPVLSPEPTEKE